MADQPERRTSGGCMCGAVRFEAVGEPIIVTHWPKEPEQIRVALEYLDEFLAQSDLYPITDGS